MRPSFSRRQTIYGGLGVLLLYIIWMAWPYLAAIVVRDAAVTTWISTAVSPISGYTTKPLYPGERVGADGRIATIVDPRADSRDLARARADMVRAVALVEAQAVQVAAMRKALNLRSGHAGRFASTFVRDLDAAMTGSKGELAAQKERLAVARAEEARLSNLHQTGLTSQSSLEEAHANVAAFEREIAVSEAALERASERHAAATDGVFLLEDGTDGNTAFQNLSDADVRLVQAEAMLRSLVAERDAARGVLAATEDSYAKSRSLDIVVPKDAMVWSLISGPGAPVQPGSPVASWIDCRNMLVDVPLSDVEAALVRPGSPADVVIEGERESRRGKVILTRGAAGTLGGHDLAAVAKGRRAGLGQALVRVTPSEADIRRCDIGHAAYVDFPTVGAFDILRARLRW